MHLVCTLLITVGCARITIVTMSITIFSELFPAILDQIITGNYSKRINMIVIQAHYRNHLAVHGSHDTRTEIP